MGGGYRSAMRHPSSIALIAAALLALGTAGCGNTNGNQSSGSGGGSGASQVKQTQEQTGSGGEEIPADDAANVLAAQRTISSLCRIDDARIGGVSDQSGSLDDLGQAVGTLVQVVRDNGANGVYEIGSAERARQLSDVLGTAAGQLRTCKQPQLADRLAKAVQDA